ncbi:hypothetical protein MASR1M32_09960 [Rhodobacter sp.]
MSATAPAATASTMIGKVVEACTSATIPSDGVSSAIFQAAPTPCISDPRFDTRVAVQISRKLGWRRGASGDWLSADMAAPCRQ